MAFHGGSEGTQFVDVMVSSHQGVGGVTTQLKGAGFCYLMAFLSSSGRM